MFIPAYLSVTLYRPFASREPGGEVSFLMMAALSISTYVELWHCERLTDFVPLQCNSLLRHDVWVYRHLHPTKLQLAFFDLNKEAG